MLHRSNMETPVMFMVLGHVGACTSTWLYFLLSHCIFFCLIVERYYHLPSQIKTFSFLFCQWINLTHHLWSAFHLANAGNRNQPRSWSCIYVYIVYEWPMSHDDISRLKYRHKHTTCRTCKHQYSVARYQLTTGQKINGATKQNIP